MTRDARVVIGMHAVLACLRQDPRAVQELFVQAQRNDPRLRDLVEAARARGVKVLAVEAARLDGLAHGGRHQGVVAWVTTALRPAFDLDTLLADLSEPALLLLLDGVTDPHNLGACLRVADGMGAHGVVVPKDRSVGLTATVAKVASGAAESMPLIPVTNLVRTIEALKQRQVWVLGADPQSEHSLLEASLTRSVAWVLGAEGRGLRRLTRERCDQLVRIPLFGQVESLNVSVAAGLCLYETRRQRQARSAPAP